MSNDPTSGPSTPVGGPSRTTDRDSPAASSADVNTPHNGADRSTEARARRRASREARRRRRKNHKKNNPGLKKKLEFVTQLLKGLDDLAFAELSVMYYME